MSENYRNDNNYRRERDDDRGDSKGGFKSFGKRRNCMFCSDKLLKLDYKQYELLASFISEKGKIVPRRISGNCAKHQRWVAREVKKARHLALLPYTTSFYSQNI